MFTLVICGSRKRYFQNNVSTCSKVEEETIENLFWISKVVLKIVFITPSISFSIS